MNPKNPQNAYMIIVSKYPENILETKGLEFHRYQIHC